MVPEQIGEAGELAMLTLAVTLALTVMVSALDVAVAGDAQLKEDVITTVIISPEARADEE